MYRLTESRTAAVVTYKSFYPVDVPESEDPMSCPTKIGNSKSFLGEATGYFTPGELRLNPVRISTTTGVSSISLPKLIVGPTNWGAVSVEGDLAAFVDGPNIGLGSLDDEQFRPPEMHAGARDLALQRAYAKASEPDFSGIVFFAELAETIAMLRDPLKALTEFIYSKDSLAHPVNRIKRFLDAGSGIWLQARYGIRPLVGEIISFFNAWEKKERKITNAFLRARGGHKFTLNEKSDTFVSNAMGHGVVLTGTLWRRTVLKTTAILYFLPKIQQKSTFQHLVDKWGFNPLLLPLAAWEILPLSFVYDWWLCIGLWIESFISAIQVNTLGLCVSERMSYERRVVVDKFRMNLADGWHEVPVSSTFTETEERLLRVVPVSIPALPSWGTGINDLWKVADSLTLLWQRAPQKFFRELPRVKLVKGAK